MKAAAVALENLSGFEDLLANLKLDIKAQQTMSNCEGEISREEQTQILLQSVNIKLETKNNHKGYSHSARLS
eukprot:2993480-Heterocapsa_arctica.AAC.1